MSSPIEFYRALPPISKAFGTLCFCTTVLVQLQLLHPFYIALIYEKVFFSFQIFPIYVLLISICSKISKIFVVQQRTKVFADHPCNTHIGQLLVLRS